MAKQPSSIDRLPEEVREKIAKLRIQGRTIDEILDHLNTLDVDISRSALGRHVKRLASLQERMRTSRDLALALVDRFGEEPDNRVARANLELMHSVVMTALTATTEDEDGEMQPVVFDPQDAMFLATALQKLAAAQKTDADRTLVLQREALKKAAGAVRAAAGEAGLSNETADFIMKKVLGVAG